MHAAALLFFARILNVFIERFKVKMCNAPFYSLAFEDVALLTVHSAIHRTEGLHPDCNGYIMMGHYIAKEVFGVTTD
jgi:hypothetical protein